MSESKGKQGGKEGTEGGGNKGGKEEGGKGIFPENAQLVRSMGCEATISSILPVNAGQAATVTDSWDTVLKKSLNTHLLLSQWKEDCYSI